MDLVMTIFASFVGIFSIWPYCSYASSVTVKIQHTAVATFQTHWYNFPLKLQKNIKIIIAFGQIIRKVDGYNLLNCDLEGFVKVKSEKILLSNKMYDIFSVII